MSRNCNLRFLQWNQSEAYQLSICGYQQKFVPVLAEFSKNTPFFYLGVV